jgi:hypothetical protein
VVQQAIIEGAALPARLAAHREACEECRFVAALSRDLVRRWSVCGAMD